MTRSGSFTLRGAGLHRLHERLSSHLSRHARVDELLATVAPDRVAGVSAYVAALQRLGVLRDDAELRDRADDRRASGRQQSRSALRIRFAAPQELAAWLLTLREAAIDRPTVFVLPEAGPCSDDERRRRALCAQWLRHVVQGTADVQPRLRSYRMSSDGALMLTETFSGEDGCSLAEALHLIGYTEASQVPLVTVTAQHHAFECAVTCAGVSRDRLVDTLTHRFLAANLLAQESGDECRFHVGRCGDPRSTFRSVTVPLSRATGFFVRPSLLELLVSILEELADRRSRDRAPAREERVDLLSRAAENPCVGYLQSVLSLRTARMEASIARGSDGLYVCSWNMHRSRSFSRLKATADLLLAATWDAFYADHGLPRPELFSGDYSAFVGGTALRTLVSELTAALDRETAARQICIRGVRRWGMSLWIGGLMSDGPET